MGGGTGAWWKTSTEKVVSEFLKGSNLFDRLAKSSYGKFMKVVEDTHIDDNNFTLPKIVVIGQESAGKSSLLESITKCPVFPRDRTVCTRMPIRLRLIHDAKDSVDYTFRNERKRLERREDLLDELHGVMKMLTDSKGNPVITEDELVVTIKSPAVPNFELIDLPGIREYPLELRETTKSLCQKYLESPDTMILCVVPATNPRLTGSQAIGMVLDNKKQANTILALTMTDKVPREDFEENVILRITRLSTEIGDLGLAGCVAVINRSHLDNETLDQAEERERNFFMDMIVDMPDEGLPYTRAQIVDNVGSDRLVIKLDVLFHGFIVRNWKDRALERVQARKQALLDELATLGTPVDEVDALQLIDVIMRQGQLDVIRCFQVAAFQAKLVAAYEAVDYTPASMGNPMDNVVYKTIKAVEEYTGYGDGEGEYGEGGGGGESQFLEDILVAMAAGLFVDFAADVTGGDFAGGGCDDTSGGADVRELNLKPGRFDTLLGMAKYKLKERLQRCAGDIHKILRDAALETAFNYIPGQRRADLIAGADIIASADVISGVADKGMRRVAAYLAFVVAQKVFVDKTVSPVYQAFMDDAPAYLVESEEWRARRDELEARLDKVNGAAATIADIDNLMGPVTDAGEGNQ